MIYKWRGPFRSARFVIMVDVVKLDDVSNSRSGESRRRFH